MSVHFLLALSTMIRNYGGYTGNLQYLANFELVSLLIQGNIINIRFINWDESDEVIELSFSVPNF